MIIRRLLLSLAVFALSIPGFSQIKRPWTGVKAETIQSYTNKNKELIPLHFQLFEMDALQVAQAQRMASGAEITKQSIQQAAKFDLPLPTGKTLTTAMFETAVLSEELQQAHPEIKTYQLVDPQTNNTAARLTITPAGISGIIFTDEGTAYISPLGSMYPDVHMIYYTKDAIAAAPLTCGLASSMAAQQPMSALAGDCKRRTFRLAVAAAGEYTIWAGGQANALGYITSTVNNISAIYERDASVRFTLVTNNSIIYPDSAADPYPPSASATSGIIAINHSVLTSNITAANYDLGIVFNYGWNGGLARLGVVCNNSLKGEAAAGLSFGTGANPTPGPQGPIFDVTVAHEIAHQFSATHTHSATNAMCGGGNINLPTAYEPGGGSTIMAYNSVCTGNFYQPRSDLYFHGGSIEQIQSYIGSGSASCASTVTSSNNAPVVSVPATSYTIPVSTPFTLKSTGTDADGNLLTYAWEQMDGGASSNVSPQASSTSGPNFRPYPPATSSERTFPPLPNIITNTATPYEVLPSVTRAMNFRVTVRDNASGGGCTAEANVTVNTNAAAGPFTVTSHSTSVSLVANGSNTTTITWNVANTNASPVNCPAVDILFSTDGGVTFPYTLLANTPNDGTQTILVPNLVTAAGRIKVQAANNIFFNVNGANITITSSCAAEGTTFSPGTNVSGAAGNASLNLTLAPLYGTLLPMPAGQIAVTDPVSNFALIDSATRACNTYSNTYYYDSYTFTVNVSGNYRLSFTNPVGCFINLYSKPYNPNSGTSYDPVNPCTNRIISNDSASTVTGIVRFTNNFTAFMQPGVFYTLIIGAAPSLFGGTLPALPANYSVALTSAPAGGNLYTALPNPGAGFSYTYVIVNNATGNITAIDAGSDLSNSSTYPSGTFTIYGLSYSNSVTPALLNSYVGGAFSTLSNDLLNQPTTLCGNLSKNNIAATVNASLPVTLLPLKIYKTGTSSALLTWGTASEQNNDYFEIQRSADGISFNQVLGKIPGKENSSIQIDYKFPDASPNAGWNHYRIKQVDKDGTSVYSNVVRANFKGKTTAVTAWPNPAGGILHIDYYTETAGKVEWMIMDGKGAMVKQATFTAQSGKTQQVINVGGLAAGSYLLRTVSGSDVQVTKFIKD